MLNVGYDKESNQKVIEQLKEFSNLFGALGLHPDSNEDLKEEEIRGQKKKGGSSGKK